MDLPERVLHAYSPIPDPDETRVLHLSAGARHNELRGRLESVHLGDDTPGFEALSYEWGNPALTRSILLEGGSSVPITESLHSALSDLRREDSDRTIWADGVCVNQADMDERGRQVALMGSIYRKAVRVITYIGPERDNSTLAVDFAVDLCKYVAAGRGSSDPRVHSADDFSAAGLPPPSDLRWAALKALFLRGWASRCWCAQEFLLNKNLVMMCGRKEVPKWDVIPRMVQHVFDRTLPSSILPGSSEDPSSLRECLAFLMRLRRDYTDHTSRFGLADLLMRSHPFLATDPRDKVYSLLGLARGRDEMGPATVDYGCAVEDLYVDVATRILGDPRNIDVVAYCNLRTKSFDGLPSWVPDWSTWHFGSHGAAVNVGYRASGSVPPAVQVDRGARTLHVAGALVDRISRLSSRVGPYYCGSSGPVRESRAAWIAEQEEVVQGLSRRYARSAGVLWRTLIGNITLHEDVADDTYKAYFYAHLDANDGASAVVKDMAREFCDAARRRSRYRRLAVTEKGFFGGVPEGAKEGDWVCLIHGLRHLFVIREQDAGFVYIGHAYVHGLMRGEAMKLDWYEKRTIMLI